MRGNSTVEDRAHIPSAAGSTPAPATKFTLEEAFRCIEALQIEMTQLRGIRTVSTNNVKKPINHAAFKKAVAAFMAGDRGKALAEYGKHYRTPSEV